MNCGSCKFKKTESKPFRNLRGVFHISFSFNSPSNHFHSFLDYIWAWLTISTDWSRDFFDSKHSQWTCPRLPWILFICHSCGQIECWMKFIPTWGKFSESVLNHQISWPIHWNCEPSPKLVCIDQNVLTHEKQKSGKSRIFSTSKLTVSRFLDEGLG